MEDFFETVGTVVAIGLVIVGICFVVGGVVNPYVDKAMGVSNGDLDKRIEVLENKMINIENKD